MQVTKVKSNQLLLNHANGADDNCLCLFEDFWEDRNNKISNDVYLRPFMFLEIPMSSFVPIGVSKTQAFSSLPEAKPYIDMAFRRIQSICTHFSKKSIVVHEKLAKDVSPEVAAYIMEQVTNVAIDSSAASLEEILRLETNLYVQGQKKKSFHRPIKQHNLFNWRQPKLFPGAPSKTTPRAVGFPFFEEDDFDSKGELKKQEDYEWNKSPWPGIPLAMKIKFYKQWCSFRFDMSMKRGSFHQNIFWKEWLQEFEMEHPELMPETEKRKCLKLC